MNDSDKKRPPQSRTVQICTIIFLAAGIGVYQVLAPSLFPKPPGGGINMNQTLGAAVVGGLCAGLGYGIGKLIDSLRK